MQDKLPLHVTEAYITDNSGKIIAKCKDKETAEFLKTAANEYYHLYRVIESTTKAAEELNQDRFIGMAKEMTKLESERDALKVQINVLRELNKHKEQKESKGIRLFR